MSCKYHVGFAQAEDADFDAGEDYETKEEALAAYESPDEHTLNYMGDYCWIVVDGPDIHEEKPWGNLQVHEETQRREYEAKRQENAMMAGMAFGCEGYNDAMGY